MSSLFLRRPARTALTAVCAGALTITLAAVPAVADEDPVAESLRAVPDVSGPIAETAESHMWSSMQHARQPFDVADFGFVEEEYFLSGTANVYDNAGGELAVVEEDVEYVNHILVRRPADEAGSSGVVLVDILNASNGFPGEDHWRRMWEWALAEGHTVIGITSKPIQVDALQNFDPERYAELTWDVEDIEREPIIADPDDPAAFDPFMVVEGAEEGLAWDIITQLGTLLSSERAGSILGGQSPDTVLLMGQSQSGVYLNTYATNFHQAQAEANGGSVWDGYLNSVGAVIERPLAQADEGGFVTVPGSEPALDVPFITVTSEGDAGLFGAATLAETELPENRRHWQVPGTPHTDLLSPVIPADEEIYRAGRLPNTQVHDPAFRDSLNLYPLEPAIIAAAEALVGAAQEGTEPAPSQWFDQADGALVRDESGNVTGGVRYGLIEYPLGQYLGAATPGAVYGSMDLISAEEFATTYGTREAYLALVEDFDAAQIEAGYLTDYGAAYFLDVATTLLDRIGVPDDGGQPGEPDEPSEPAFGFYLNDAWSGKANHVFTYGRPGDEVFVGDWDGDGQDTITVRRGNLFYVNNRLGGGEAQQVIAYGRPGDTVVVGDWDGDGADTLAVRRGNAYHVKNSISSGSADQVVFYGKASDDVVVGNWDGQDGDSLTVRRGNAYYVKNTIAGGEADQVVFYGKATDTVLAGDWDGDGDDTFTVRRGNAYYVKNTIAGGEADWTTWYGRASDEVYVGDWNSDGTDTLGVRRLP